MARTRNFFTKTLTIATLIALLGFGLLSVGSADAANVKGRPAHVKSAKSHPVTAKGKKAPAKKVTAKAVSQSGTGAAAWPFKTLQLGAEENLGSTVPANQTGKMGFRYAYLAGGANTGTGWANYASAVPTYISDSEAAGVVPVFTYNQLQQSLPGNRNSNECDADAENMTNPTTMLAYFQDLKLFFQKAAQASGPVVMQYEPDLWGCVEWASVGGKSNTFPFAGDATNVPAAIASSGMPELKALPNTAAGLAQAVITLRNEYAPKVLVGYHLSYWGTGVDLQLNHPDDATVQAMATDSVAFYRSLGANFDVIFSETHDRDAGYRQAVDHETTSYWWTQTDFQHLGEYLGAIHQALGLPSVIWQIPTGTTNMNNTPGNYADNQVQSLLGNTAAAHALLKSYAAAGVTGLLFGPSAPNDTPITSSLVNLMGNYASVGAIQAS
jgi:hypothetical protein